MDSKYTIILALNVIEIYKHKLSSLNIKMDIEPIWNERALRAGNTIVIADLHFGYERELEEKGINLPSQSEKMITSVKRLLRKKEAKRLIINGDLKHNIPKASWQEYRDVPKAVDEWLKIVEEVHLVPGNHDGGIQKYLPNEVIFHGSEGAVIEDVGYFHGHAIPSEEVISTEKLVLAHIHPMIALVDSFKNKMKNECWIRLKYHHENGKGEGVLMPHFNQLLGGTSVNVTEDPYIGPFLKNEKILEEKVYLLDGTYLGEREDLIPDQGL